MLSFFLFIFLTAKAQATCGFKADVSKVFALSGPIAVALKNLGLLNNPVVKGISVFNPISQEDFKGPRYPGGIFLGRDTFSEFKGGIVFYDEGRELSRILAPMNSIEAVQIKTRGLTPGQVTTYVIKELEPFLSGCVSELAAFTEATKNLEMRLLSRFTHMISVIYFLGEYRMSKPPEMLIVNDGIVKWLVGQKKIITYPSELAYVNWSAKILASLPKTTIRVAVKDSGARMEKRISKIDGYINLVYPGALVPGISQLEAWNYLVATP